MAKQDSDGKGGCGPMTIVCGICLVGIILTVLGLDIGWILILIGVIIGLFDLFFTTMKTGM